MQRFLTVAAFVFIMTVFSLGQSSPSSSVALAGPPNPCAVKEQRQLDFWVGEWNLTWPGPQAGSVQHGTNSIQRVLDSCVVTENFSGGSDAPLRGTSVSMFDTTTDEWKQTWVDNQGSYLDFVGGFKDGQMILAREATLPNGTRSEQRMVFKNITPDEFDWSWESSKDHGKTWQVVWPIHYQRRK